MIIKSLEHLNLISEQIANQLKKSDCIFLVGEIGTGKTTFTRSIINYLRKKEKKNEVDVLSPTFNLLYEYELTNYKIMHYDLYRLKSTKEIEQLGIFNDNKDSIKIIEWPELIKESVENKIEFKFSYMKKINERKMEYLGYGRWKHFKIDEL
tara:strand:+ start:5993 stop:6448 length:456 start_codon:yes stop_codon:yes gene_type:complete